MGRNYENRVLLLIFHIMIKLNITFTAAVRLLYSQLPRGAPLLKGTVGGRGSEL